MAEILDVRRQAPGLVVARSRDRMADYGVQIWGEVKARKHATCAVTGGQITPGAMVYRPHTNLGNRMWRVLSAAMDALAARGVATDQPTNGGE